VWTAIRDQEEGLPPTLVMRAERELLVLRPLSAEGRELLAAPAFGSPEWALSLLPENRT
jgi:hypothetical protein